MKPKDSCDVLITNSVGITLSGKKIIHSPSRWSEAVDCQDRWFAYYPFFLGTLSSLLKRETPLKITLIDGCLRQLNPVQFKNAILTLSPRFLFMECASLVFEENISLALEIKKQCGAMLLFAGPHASLYPDECLSRGIDYVFPGEFESAVLDFFKNEAYRHMPKGIYRAKLSIPFRDMPWPEDTDVSRMEYGLPGEPSSDYREIQMYATRGCRGICSFCVVRHVYFQVSKHETRNPLDVVLEMEHLKKKYPELEGVFFDEEDHFNSMPFIRQFCEILIRRKNTLKIEALGRLQPLDFDLLPLMKQAGYYKLRIGVESLDLLTQKKIGKRIPLHRLETFLSLCQSCSLDVYMTFQVGLPGSSKEGDKQTLLYIIKWIKQNLVKNIQMSIYTPFPGTPEYTQLVKNKNLTSVNFADYNGGEKSVVNWPDYSADDITRNYHYFLMLRDHHQLRERLKRMSGYAWIMDRWRKHSMPTLCKKIYKRFCIEFKILKLSYHET